MKIIDIVKSKFLKTAGIYTIASTLNSAIPFLLMPLLTRVLKPDDYGTISMFGVLISIFIPLVGIGIHGAIARAYYEKSQQEMRIYIFNSIVVIAVMLLLVTVFTQIFSNKLSNLLNVSRELMLVATIVAFAYSIISIVLTLWQIKIKPINYGIFQVAQTAVNLGVSIYLVVILELGWKGRVLGQGIAACMFAIFGIVILIRGKWLQVKYSKEYIIDALKFGIPLIPHSIGSVIISMTDRVFVTKLVGLEATGLYSVGNQVGLIISILSSAFNQAYVPWLYEQLNRNKVDVNKKIVKFTYLYFVIIMLLAIGLSMITPIIMHIYIGGAFKDSGQFVKWIALGYAFGGMYYMVSGYIFYAKKNIVLAKVTAIAAILNPGLNYIFIKHSGAVGAAQATALVYFIQFILTWIAAARTYKMPWKLANK